YRLTAQRLELGGRLGGHLHVAIGAHHVVPSATVGECHGAPETLAYVGDQDDPCALHQFRIRRGRGPLKFTAWGACCACGTPGGGRRPSPRGIRVGCSGGRPKPPRAPTAPRPNRSPTSSEAPPSRVSWWPRGACASTAWCAATFGSRAPSRWPRPGWWRANAWRPTRSRSSAAWWSSA